MKFYNPFKPHIVVSNTGKFAIRELGILGWIYLDNNNYKFYQYWFDTSSINKWSLFNDLEDAKCFLDKYKKTHQSLKFNRVNNANLHDNKATVKVQ